MVSNHVDEVLIIAGNGRFYNSVNNIEQERRGIATV